MIGERTRSDIRRSGEVASEINVGSHVDDKGRHPEGDVRDDEIGDVLEDIVIGPEGKDVDIISDGDIITNNQDDPEIVIPDSQDDAEIDDFGRLWMATRATLQYLQEYSRANNIIGLDSGERPLSLSYWRLLCRVNVDWITRPLMEAIPPVVRKLFEKDTPELKEWSTLPDGESEDRMGICVDKEKAGVTTNTCPSWPTLASGPSNCNGAQRLRRGPVWGQK
ncbi:hypothetical protein N7497_003345 [Penicillium chrysogenum]|nr:hypothetical protein N7497_003345 [Penicillium chrysogenum]